MRVLVTGSADGIGRQTALELVGAGHRVVMHARNEQRAADAWKAVPGADDVLVGELGSLASTTELAGAAAASGGFDAVIHNAGVGSGDSPARTLTEDGLERIFQTNVLAPYVLTALIPRPARLVYLSSGLHASGQVHLDDLQAEHRPWSSRQAYCDSKLLDVVLAFAVARLWSDVASNAVDPGWIRSRMGGPSAPGDLAEGADTPVWLATSDESAATVTGCYFKQRQQLPANPSAQRVDVQHGLLVACARISGVDLPRDG
jgi:NAD(P)-dependent dehydrogenase (short-subunit alcohol dehydrogenase family)